jgi:signal transduction histidine kinase
VGADSALIGRALDELVDNALKFSPDGGTITVSAKKASGGVEFSVLDEGLGIPKDRRATVFEDFSQGDASSTRQFGGLGLGLSFIRRVIEAHGSTLRITGRTDGGTRVSFVLSQSAAANGQRGKRAKTAAQTGGAS